MMVTAVKKKNRFKRDLKRNYAIYLIALPVIVYFAIFSYGPMAGVLAAFQDYNLASGLFGSPWVGMKHFKWFLFESHYFWEAVGNTLIFSLLDLIIVFPAPIILALMLNSVKKGRIFKRSIQTAVYVPFFISVVVVAGLMRSFLMSDGFINQAFVRMGLTSESNPLLGNPRYFKGVITVSNIWQTIGFQSIIFVAALSSIDPVLYDAAKIDGAGRTATLLHITLPSILPMIMMMLILKIGSLLNVGYEKILLLMSSNTESAGNVIGSYVYRLTFETGAGHSLPTAIGLFNSLISLILLLLANFVSKKATGHGLV